MTLCGFDVGIEHPIFLIAGPCVIESEQMAIDTAGQLKEMCAELGIPFIYKSSYDKANRSSNKTFRGFGMEEGLRILDEVRRQVGVPILTDVHTEEQVKPVAAVVDVLQTPAFLCRQTDFITAVATCGKPVNMEKGLEILAKVKKEIGVHVLTDIHEVDEIKPVAAVVDVLQTPAFLCRQTDFITAVATCGKPVNIKKGQFLAPGDMKQVVQKAKEANGGLDNIMVCERGASFGYNTLVSDMRGLAIMRETNCPVVFDATHSVQQPGGQGDKSGGQREHVPVLARAAVASGIAGLFMETHPDPAKA